MTETAVAAFGAVQPYDGVRIRSIPTLLAEAVLSDEFRLSLVEQLARGALTATAYARPSRSSVGTAAGGMPTAANVQKAAAQSANGERFEDEEEVPQQPAARATSPSVMVLTLVHYLTAECRPLLLLWWTGLSIIVAEGKNGPIRENRFMSAPMQACISKWASGIIWGPGAVECGPKARVIEYASRSPPAQHLPSAADAASHNPPPSRAG